MVTPITYTRPSAPKRKLMELTPTQEKRVTEWRDEWLRIGMDTSPADRPRAEAAVRAMCARIGVECPPIVWCNGPATMVLTYFALRRLSVATGASLGDSLGDSLRASLRDSLRDSLGVSLDDSLGDSLDGSLRGSLGDSLGDSLDGSLGVSLGDSLGDSLDGSLGVSLRDSLRDSLGDSLGDSLDGSLGVSLRDSLRDSLRGSLRDSQPSASTTLDEILWYWTWWMGGQHSLAWWAHYAYCRDELGVNVGEQQSADLDLWLEVGRSCGWWRPRNGIVWMCERPLVQTLDDEGRLHNDTGPAILCRDSWAVWAVHGVRVSRQIVEVPDTLRATEIRDEANAEVRRVMMERFGAERYMRELKAEMVSADDWGKLWRLPVAPDEDGPMQMVEMVNSTAEPDGEFKVYWERVPPTVQTPLEALAWQADMSPDIYVTLAAQT